MIRWLLAFLTLTAAAPMVDADTILAARTIPARTLIGPSDIIVHDSDIAGAISDQQEVLGMEARVALYAGRPIRRGDLGPPAIIERNAIIPLHYIGGGLAIRTEGRALGRAGAGEYLRVMNLSSRTTVSARIGNDGVAYVSP